MKSRPILFSGPMVRAILDGTKTQTRRAVKKMDNGRVKMPGSDMNWHLDDPNCVKACPYGQPGDRLWVRETWRTTGDGGRCNDIPPSKLQPHAVWYDADGNAPADLCCGKTRVSIFMMQWASRITLEITAIRCERLQDISEQDAINEGIAPEGGERWKDYLGAPCGWMNPVDSYRTLWESINGPDSWDTNSWVWVVEFRRIKP